MINFLIQKYGTFSLNKIRIEKGYRSLSIYKQIGNLLNDELDYFPGNMSFLSHKNILYVRFMIFRERQKSILFYV